MRIAEVPEETISSISKSIYKTDPPNIAYLVMIFSADWARENLDSVMDRPLSSFASHLIVAEEKPAMASSGRVKL